MSGSAPRRLLIATNQLMAVGGSEVIALETATYFARAGCSVTVFANWIGSPMAEMIEAVTGSPVITEPVRIRPFTFDTAYVQHQMLGLFDYRASDEDRDETRIIAGRL